MLTYGKDGQQTIPEQAKNYKEVDNTKTYEKFVQDLWLKKDILRHNTDWSAKKYW